MKITIIAVSVSALSQIQIFQKEYAKKYSEDAIDFAVFYVAGMENKYLMHPEILENAVREADVAIIDLMGVSEALREIVRRGLENCRGQRIVIGNELREYLRLGTFSMEAMGKMMKSSQKKPLTGDVSEEETNQADTKENKKPTASALEKMRRIRRMAMILGNVLPFEGYEAGVFADGLLAAGNLHGYRIILLSDFTKILWQELSAEGKALYDAVRNLSERSIFACLRGRTG